MYERERRADKHIKLYVLNNVFFIFHFKRHSAERQVVISYCLE